MFEPRVCKSTDGVVRTQTNHWPNSNNLPGILGCAGASEVQASDQVDIQELARRVLAEDLQARTKRRAAAAPAAPAAPAGETVGGVTAGAQAGAQAGGQGSFVYWSEAEEDALCRGVERYGAGNWTAIKADAELGVILANRSHGSMKQKWHSKKFATIREAVERETAQERQGPGWSAAELDALCRGVKRYGVSRWTAIKADAELGVVLTNRSNYSIRDKWHSKNFAKFREAVEREIAQDPPAQGTGWSAAELDALCRGVKRYGTGRGTSNWTAIKADAEFGVVLTNRSTANMMNKWRSKPFAKFREAVEREMAQDLPGGSGPGPGADAGEHAAEPASNAPPLPPGAVSNGTRVQVSHTLLPPPLPPPPSLPFSFSFHPCIHSSTHRDRTNTHTHTPHTPHAPFFLPFLSFFLPQVKFNIGIFKGTVVKSDPQRVFVRYDDGDEEWVSLTSHRLKGENGQPLATNATRKRKRHGEGKGKGEEKGKGKGEGKEEEPAMGKALVCAALAWLRSIAMAPAEAAAMRGGGGGTTYQHGGVTYRTLNLKQVLRQLRPRALDPPPAPVDEDEEWLCSGPEEEEEEEGDTWVGCAHADVSFPSSLVGRRVGVWWGGDRRFYRARVLQDGALVYDLDGMKEFRDLSKEMIRLAGAISKHSSYPAGRALRVRDIDASLVGCQAEVFWPATNLWYLVRIEALESHVKFGIQHRAKVSSDRSFPPSLPPSSLPRIGLQISHANAKAQAEACVRYI